MRNGIFRRLILWAGLILFLAIPACSMAQSHPLAGTWRLAGGAEVLGSGLQLREDGVCVLMGTDDFDHFPTEKLFALKTDCTWREENGVLTLCFAQGERSFPWKLNRTGTTVQLGEGDSAGQYARCSEALVLDADPVDEAQWAEVMNEAWNAQLLGCRALRNGSGQEFTALLVRQERSNILYLFRENGQEGDQLWARTEIGIPQGTAVSGAQPAVLSLLTPGVLATPVWDEELTYALETDASWFEVLVANEESICEKVTYRWQEDGFHLVSYWYPSGGFADVRGDVILLYNLGDDRLEAVPLAVHTDLRALDYEALPRQEASMLLPPMLESCPAAFPAGEQWPVYAGPGEQYPRSGSGKGLVSTNGDIDVLGAYDGYLLIVYKINPDRHRYGWIDAEALEVDATVPEIRFLEGFTEVLSRNCSLTDDPLCSGSELVGLKKGTEVEWLASLDEEWAYIRVETKGNTWYGFVPCEAFVASNG